MAPKDSKKGYQLTKTKYCTGLQCLKALYLDVYNKDLATPPDEKQKQTFAYGTKVGIEAHKSYPGGVLIEFDHFHKIEALEATKKAIEAGAPAIFEAAFLYEKTLVRVDILKRNSDGTWDIVEVKSSTKVKDEHIPDMAIQRYVVEKVGMKVGRSILKHINNECRHPDFSNLFTDADCTEKVIQEMRKIPDSLTQMLGILEADKEPNIAIGPHCSSPYDCAFKNHCWKKVPENSVFELNGVWEATKFQLYRKGIVQISQIPDGMKVSRSKPQQIQAVKDGKPVIDRNAIEEFISQLKPPLFFLDFETLNPPIPLFPGTSPWEHIPVQFSCHIQESQLSEMRQVEYLATPPKDPREEVAIKLIETLGTKGPIVAYNARFEKNIISGLADYFPSMANELRSLLPRFVDLLDIFKDHYFHPDFHGSNSIKVTLPVLVPTMTYEGMDVYNGIVAQVEFAKLFESSISNAEKTRIRDGLLRYCGQDTLAMVELYRELARLIMKDGGSSDARNEKRKRTS